jgi:hypothetical protein
MASSSLTPLSSLFALGASRPLRETDKSTDTNARGRAAGRLWARGEPQLLSSGMVSTRRWAAR